MPDFDTCLLNLRRADSMPSFSPTVTWVKTLKKIIESFKAISGIGAKSAEAFYKAGFKTPKSITTAKDEDLLAVPGVGINLVKKLKNIK